MDPFWYALPGLVIWTSILLLPWRPWSTRESLESIGDTDTDLNRVSVLIPARNEASVITRTLDSVARQGTVRKIVLVDDESTDGTAAAALALPAGNLDVIKGSPLPAGWSGKLWALEQGRRRINSEYTLLLDADIELASGTIATLVKKADAEKLQLVSLMASLRMESFWEKLLMPAFIYFFKLLYPFSLSNSENRPVAAAAGGCMLLRTDALQAIGGFGALRGALIDDCTLARLIKQNGGRTWTGLTHSVTSHRRYRDLQPIWAMVTRTAFTQLKYSPLLLLLCTLLMFAAFILPVAALLYGHGLAGNGSAAVAATAWSSLIIMCGTYLPVLRYYGLHPLRAALLPVAGTLYLGMTWASAARHWRGTRAEWKGRTYKRQPT